MTVRVHWHRTWHGAEQTPALDRPEVARAFPPTGACRAAVARTGQPHFGTVACGAPLLAGVCTRMIAEGREPWPRGRVHEIR